MASVRSGFSQGAPHARDVAVEQEVLAGCASVTLLYLNAEAEFVPYCDVADAIIHLTSRLPSSAACEMHG